MGKKFKEAKSKVATLTRRVASLRQELRETEGDFKNEPDGVLKEPEDGFEGSLIEGLDWREPDDEAAGDATGAPE